MSVSNSKKTKKGEEGNWEQVPGFPRLRSPDVRPCDSIPHSPTCVRMRAGETLSGDGTREKGRMTNRGEKPERVELSSKDRRKAVDATIYVRVNVSASACGSSNKYAPDSQNRSEIDRHRFGTLSACERRGRQHSFCAERSFGSAIGRQNPQFGQTYARKKKKKNFIHRSLELVLLPFHR